MIKILCYFEFNMINACCFELIQHSLLGGNEASLENRTIFPRGFERIRARRGRTRRRRENGTGNEDQAQAEKKGEESIHLLILTRR
jgi:hypothetical protein